jgi:hypothetical protein
MKSYFEKEKTMVGVDEDNNLEIIVDGIHTYFDLETAMELQVEIGKYIFDMEQTQMKSLTWWRRFWG